MLRVEGLLGAVVAVVDCILQSDIEPFESTPRIVWEQASNSQTLVPEITFFHAGISLSASQQVTAPRLTGERTRPCSSSLLRTVSSSTRSCRPPHTQNYVESIQTLLVPKGQESLTFLVKQVDLVTDDELASVRELVASLSPQATLIECTFAEVPIEQVVGLKAFDADRVADSLAMAESAAAGSSWANKGGAQAWGGAGVRTVTLRGGDMHMGRFNEWLLRVLQVHKLGNHSACTAPCGGHRNT